MEFPYEETLARIRELLSNEDRHSLRGALEGMRVQDIARMLMTLEPGQQLMLFREITDELRSEVFSHLDRSNQHFLLHELNRQEVQWVLSGLVPDDLTSLLESLSTEEVRTLLRLLPMRALRNAMILLGYPEDSAGRLMTPQFVAVQPQWTISEALDHIRDQSERGETVNTVFVIDSSGVLLDSLPLKRFILGRPTEKVEKLMQGDVLSIEVNESREAAVRQMQHYDLEVLPVVDGEQHLLGIVTVDDILDVMQEETTEDFHKMASVGNLNLSLREAKPSLLYQKRIGWLLTLVFVNIFSGLAIAYYEVAIESLVVLVFFLPLIIASGGNAGAQSSTLMVRALATGDVQARDWLRLWGRELSVSLALGLTMGFAVSLIGLWRGGPDVALVVALAMICVVMVGSMIGVLLPMLLERLKIDPATASTPLITSIADISGIVIYFAIAVSILQLPLS